MSDLILEESNADKINQDKLETLIDETVERNLKRQDSLGDIENNLQVTIE